MCDFAKAGVKASPHLLFCFWLASIEIKKNVKTSLLWVLEQSLFHQYNRKKHSLSKTTDHRVAFACWSIHWQAVVDVIHQRFLRIFSWNYPSIVYSVCCCSQMYWPASIATLWLTFRNVWNKVLLCMLPYRQNGSARSTHNKWIFIKGPMHYW